MSRRWVSTWALLISRLRFSPNQAGLRMNTALSSKKSGVPWKSACRYATRSSTAFAVSRVTGWIRAEIGSRFPKIFHPFEIDVLSVEGRCPSTKFAIQPPKRHFEIKFKRRPSKREGANTKQDLGR